MSTWMKSYIPTDRGGLVKAGCSFNIFVTVKGLGPLTKNKAARALLPGLLEYRPAQPTWTSQEYCILVAPTNNMCPIVVI